MGYLDDLLKEILALGEKKPIEYAQEKADAYKKAGSINYALYKSASSKEEAKSRYAAAQTAYAKSEAWQEVVDQKLEEKDDE